MSNAEKINQISEYARKTYLEMFRQAGLKQRTTKQSALADTTVKLEDGTEISVAFWHGSDRKWGSTQLIFTLFIVPKNWKNRTELDGPIQSMDVDFDNRGQGIFTDEQVKAYEKWVTKTMLPAIEKALNGEKVVASTREATKLKITIVNDKTETAKLAEIETAAGKGASNSPNGDLDMAVAFLKLIDKASRENPSDIEEQLEELLTSNKEFLNALRVIRKHGNDILKQVKAMKG